MLKYPPRIELTDEELDAFLKAQMTEKLSSMFDACNNYHRY